MAPEVLAGQFFQWVKEINKIKPTWNIVVLIDDNLSAFERIECDCKVVGTIKDWKPKENERFVMAIIKIKEVNN